METVPTCTGALATAALLPGNPGAVQAAHAVHRRETAQTSTVRDGAGR